tara:strand:+ start:1482 stop:2387 length:906 start_codon:yes stop_codon:yes gene_type:complete
MSILFGIVLLILAFFTVQETKETTEYSGEIPESEIINGGPGKDGIPSIDAPTFVSAEEATFVSAEDFGIGLNIDGDIRFYPFQILVWHEIVNDRVGDKAVAVTYCPLCRTGVTYERIVRGEEVEFGVSGKLWKSNLLMYNRGDEESLWSQVLGRAVVGPHTGEVLTLVSSDTVRFGDWKRKHPSTKVLSQNTGAVRAYGTDPYGDYYTNEEVSFGATFNDARLHPKAYVIGVEVDGAFKAYEADALPVGITNDTFNDVEITIEKSDIGEVRMFADDIPLPYIGGFWFSWLAVHPTTELWEK